MVSESKERWCLIKLLGQDAYIGRIIFYAPYTAGQPLFMPEADYDALEARVAQLEAALRYIGKACDLSDDETDVGITYRTALAPPIGES